MHKLADVVYCHMTIYSTSVRGGSRILEMGGGGGGGGGESNAQTQIWGPWIGGLCKAKLKT